MDYVYDAATGLAGGLPFAAGLTALAAEKRVSAEDLAAGAGGPDFLAGIMAGAERVPVAVLARFAQLLRVRPIEFMQKTSFLSLATYAAGLDPLFFLPAGQIRHDARIYMREINPRHAVPEGDMTKRNPALKAIADDPLLDPLGKLELELAYLLRTAAVATGGRL